MGSDSNSASALSPGALAAAIVLPILFVVALAGFAIYYFYYRKSSGLNQALLKDPASGSVQDSTYRKF